MRVLFVFCEGPHDAQFIGRILKDSGQYTEFKESLKNYPVPLKGYLNTKFKNQNIDEIRIGKPKHPLVPACVYHNVDRNSLILPISMGGMDKTEDTKTLFNEIKNSFALDILIRPESTVENFSVLFLYDSDSRGIVDTTTLFNKRFYDCFPDGTYISPNLWTKINEYRLGLFIFTGADGDTGTLEDNIVELFRNSDTSLVSAAQIFVSEKFEPITSDGDPLAYETKKMKGILTACGQAEKKNAGCALTVVVRDSKLLNGAFDFDDNTAQWTTLLNFINGAFE